MAWEWSHSQEAYDTARDNLAKQDRDWLEICLAEIETEGVDTAVDLGYEEWSKIYAAKLEIIQHLSQDEIVQKIWDWASEHRTCDNGGFNAHMCPDGCHTVDFG